MWDKIHNMKAANMDENQIEDEMVDVIENQEDDVIEADEPPVALEDMMSQKRLVEAILFASPEPVSLKSLQNKLPETADVGRILLELQEEYAGRGVNLMRLEDAWAFRTAQDIGPYMAMTKKEEKKLSRAALETLAVISYHQPVTRAEIENIRGVATNKGTLDVLLEAGWIKPGRRRETPGRPVTWITTNVFLDEFGISQLTDLPGLKEMQASGLLDTRPAIDTIPGAADLFAAMEGEESLRPESDEDESATGEFDQQEDAVEDEEMLDEKESA